MKCRRPIVFPLLAAISLMLMLLVLAAWGRSFYSSDAIRYSRVDRQRFTLKLYWIGLETRNVHVGYLAYAFRNSEHFASEVSNHWGDWENLKSAPMSVRSGWWEIMDESFSPSERGTGRTRTFVFAVHAFVPATIFAILPALWLLTSIRRHLRRELDANLCSACGYDLRATPKRCPECGAVPSTLLTEEES